MLHRCMAIAVWSLGFTPDIYLPLLDTRLTAQEAQQMFEEMERAAQEAKRTVTG